MGGNKGEASFSKGSNGGEREGGKDGCPRRKKGPFIAPISKYDRWSTIESFQTKTGLSGPDFWKNPALNEIGISRPCADHSTGPGFLE